MSAVAVARLVEERKKWRKDPIFGFAARPSKNKDGTLNLMRWDCVIPGRPGTIWEGGRYRLKMIFKKNYPVVPPTCVFVPPIFHPNVFNDGTVCLSILDHEKHWRDSMTVKQILRGIQNLLTEPNTLSPARSEAIVLLTQTPREYERRVKAQAKATAAVEI